MKLHLLNRSSIPDSSITVRHNAYKHFLKIWHFHEEFELVLILKSSGVRFVGDNIEKFLDGDLVLIGENLPHMWLNDKEYFEKDSSLQAEAIAIHFKRSFLGDCISQVPEMRSIDHLLNVATSGIKFEGVDEYVIEEIKYLIHLDSTSRIIQLLDLLNKLSKHKNIKSLSSPGFVKSFHKTEEPRLGKMYEFIYQNFNTPISAGDVAGIMFMTTSSFSRFFRKIHRKPFTRYLNEIRIGYACKLLLSSEESVSSICYLCGFNNLSNFNRQFKLIKGLSPTAYQKLRNVPIAVPELGLAEQ